MDGIKLNLAGLKDKVANKLKSENKKHDQKKDKRNNKKIQDSTVVETKGSENLNKKPSSQNDVSDEIRREALELGATEEDLKLVAGVSEGEESEQEFNDDVELEKGFSDDLSKFMKNIGLENNEAIVVSDEVVKKELEELNQEEDEDEDEDDEEDGEDEDGESADEDASKEEEDEQQEDQDDEELEEEEELENNSRAVVSGKQTPEKSKPKKEELPQHKRVDASTVINTAKLTIPPQIDWYNIPLDLSGDASNLTPEQIDKLYYRGKEALEADNQAYYEEFSKTSSQRKFLSQILSDGTLSDKISALTLLIQEAPVHNIKSFETILNFTNKKSRNSALQSINALKDLLINGLLPDRKLRAFKNQPLSLLLSKKQLALFYFEDYLKSFYFQIIQVLEKLSHDPIIHVRMNVVSHIFDLLKSKPEQEVNLLKLGINKIGDIDNKVSSKTSYQILQLEQAHPNMKKIVIDAVIDGAFKKNTDYHTNYYSILTLNQTILTRREEDVANSLVRTYFALFEKLLIESDPHNVDKATDEKSSKENNFKNRKKNFKKGKKGGKSVKTDKSDEEVIEEKYSKLFSALLTGLNRAFPFSNLPNEIFSKHLDTLFKITHSSNFNTSVQSLVLIFQIIQTQKLNSDRYYRTLYESLLDNRLLTSSKQGIYLNLLFKSLKHDSNISRVLAFVKRIVQICYNWVNVGPIAGMFFLLAELEKAVPQVRNLAINTPVDHRYVDDSDDEEHFKDVDSDTEKKEVIQDKKTSNTEYDSRKRDPRYANAGNSSIWEINEFLNHYHPTVQLYAESFLNQEKQVKPDLGLFTLSHFLDRFVYRNAKQKPITKGSSIMQPLGGTHTGSLLVKASNKNLNEVPVNTENWLEKKLEDIRPDEKFFHQYFSTKDQEPSRLNEAKEDDFDDESDLDDDEVWDALVKSQPEIDGDVESDLDDLSDFDAEEFSDDDDDDDDDDNIEGEIVDTNADVEDEESDVGSDFELQTIGIDDDDVEEDEEDDDENSASDDEVDQEEAGEFNGFSESEDEEAELFNADRDDEYSSEEEIEEEQASRKRPAETSDNAKSSSKKSKKSKFKDLPVFASAEDYALYLNSDDEN